MHYQTAFLLWAGLIVDVVALCMIIYLKKRKALDEKSTLSVVYRVPLKGKSVG
ncbi:MAG: hypothetical protein RBS73_09250 [Prolixibacteraceae bacterium]|jgi:hypothetical protein|nr:hypothetical protein [Prolixibacteraceae bacterium]